MTTSYKLTFSQKQFYHFAQLLTFGNEARKQAMANKWIAYMSGIFHKEYIISDHIVAIAHWFSIYTGGALRKLSSVLEEITHE